MSINEPIILRYNPNRQQYYFSQGNETFYDVDNKWLEFDTMEDALTFGFEVFSKFKIADDLPAPEPVYGGYGSIPKGQMRMPI